MRKAILVVGGALNLLLAVLHLFFWSMFNWKEELARLSADNQAIFTILHVIVIFIIFYFSVMSFLMINEKKMDLFSKSFLILIAGFYTIRLILGYPYFGFSFRELTIWIVCLVMIAGYLSLLFEKKEDPLQPDKNS